MLEPTTGLAINDLSAGVEFFKSLPSIDDPVLLREPAFEEVEEYYPAASVELIEGWEADLQQRAGRWLNQVPDPPGEGPVVTARYWLSRYSYDMEVRRRGKHFPLRHRGESSETWPEDELELRAEQ